ncbi:MAG: hypothetical protein M4D80_15935 [Myxococcota bacterium]|nr:hypothetical protein [Deltaproteobacteria bacterium]MDQ3336658.1 hypothetical protein [Myxococcota bacterium]
MNRITVEICSRTFVYPSECPCCGADPDGELPIPYKASKRTIAEDTTREVLFPYCARCVEHVLVWEAGSMASALIMLTGIAGALAIGLSQNGLRGLAVFFAVISVAVFVTSIVQSRARSRCLPSCATGGRAVIFYGWSGSTTMFAFESATYTARFAEENANNLVSVGSLLRHLLEAHKVARLQVPTPARATRTVSPPRDLRQWIASLEQARTRVARRIQLCRALDVVIELDERAALVQIVSRAELVPLFERIEGAPAATQRRELQRALTDARADNLTSELRAAKLRELEHRLGSLSS